MVHFSESQLRISMKNIIATKQFIKSPKKINEILDFSQFDELTISKKNFA